MGIYGIKCSLEGYKKRKVNEKIYSSLFPLKLSQFLSGKV